jgi:thymidylate synthase (FAD)
VRHRAGFSYSQLSQQYHDESDAKFVRPFDLSSDSAISKVWDESVDAAKKSYRKLFKELNRSAIGRTLDSKERSRLIRSIARSILPAATETNLVITANARAWRNLLAARGHTKGDGEMIEFCAEVFNILSSHSPALFSDFELIEGPIGRLVVRKNLSPQ